MLTQNVHDSMGHTEPRSQPGPAATAAAGALCADARDGSAARVAAVGATRSAGPRRGGDA